MTELEALQKAIELAQGQGNLAKGIGHTQASISKMLKKGRASASAAPLIETALQGRVTCRELRPDLYQSYQKQAP